MQDRAGLVNVESDRRHFASWVSVLVGLLLLTGCKGPTWRATFEARVVGVTDGDTIIVLRDLATVKIRLNGIDCPERDQPFGSRAKLFTSETAFGRTVTVKPKSRDRYGRVVAEVVLPDGRVLNRELVDSRPCVALHPVFEGPGPRAPRAASARGAGRHLVRR